MDFTRLSHIYFKPLAEAERRKEENLEQSQRALLRKLVAVGQKTKWGVSLLDHSTSINGHRTEPTEYEQFVKLISPADYEAIRPWVMRMVNGEKDVLWEGRCNRFAQSSGTSDGKSKYIPITPRGLQHSHYRGAALSVAKYLLTHPDSHIFGGKNLILGGSFANELNLTGKVKVGDLSASLIDNINPVANLFRTPSKETALMADWSKKLPAIVESSAREDIRSLSGVPSWFLTVLKAVMAHTGATEIHEIWPNLEVFFHGGISFEPYRTPYSHIIAPDRMNYWENYNASEGFFAAQHQPGKRPMTLLADVDTFYEFIPVSLSGGNPSPVPIPSWEVEAGKIYEMVITSSNGLWRYRIGDTVKIESLNPLTITIAGRTKHFINAFGEEVMVHNTDAALREACRKSGVEAINYIAAPVYAGDRTRGRHEWLIEFSCQPRDLEAFADMLDSELQSQNSDYQAKRTGNLFLDRLTIIPATTGVFDRWLATTGKLGGQRKIPRLDNDRRFIDNLLRMNSGQTH